MKLSAILFHLCIPALFASVQAYTYYKLVDSTLDVNSALKITSYLPSQNFPVYSVFRYRVTAPVGHQLRAVCDFRLSNCQQNSFLFYPDGKTSSRQKYCTNQYLLNTDSNVFKGHYLLVNPRYRSWSQSFSCNLKACECGRRNIDSERIVNGKATSANAYPFFASLTDVQDRNRHRYICGSTIISNKWILTAAHCIMNIKNDKISLQRYAIVVGAHDERTPSPHERTIDIKRLIVHPHWQYATYDSDIALIELVTSVKFNDYISPVCLPYKNEASDLGRNERATVIGYGKTSKSGFQTNVVNEVQLKIEPWQDCKNAYDADKSVQKITNNMMCTYESKKDACENDSGGPLFVQKKGRSYQVGIVSWGKGCAQDKYPGVYTYLPNFLDWIRQETREDFCWS